MPEDSSVDRCTMGTGLITYTLQEAAEKLHIHASTALELAQKGELSGARIGHAWVFTDEHLREYLFAKVEEQTSQRRSQEQAKRVVAMPVVVPGPRRRRPLPRLPDENQAGNRAAA